jgi:adenylate kinase
VAVRDSGIELDYVLKIHIDDAHIFERMRGRRVHLASGRTYHTCFNPPKVSGCDDITCEPLVERDDDRTDIVKNRLEIYHAYTFPVFCFYREWSLSNDVRAPRFIIVDGNGDIHGTREAVFRVLGGTFAPSHAHTYQSYDSCNRIATPAAGC